MPAAVPVVSTAQRWPGDGGPVRRSMAPGGTSWMTVVRGPGVRGPGELLHLWTSQACKGGSAECPGGQVLGGSCSGPRGLRERPRGTGSGQALVLSLSQGEVLQFHGCVLPALQHDADPEQAPCGAADERQQAGGLWRPGALPGPEPAWPHAAGALVSEHGCAGRVSV